MSQLRIRGIALIGCIALHLASPAVGQARRAPGAAHPHDSYWISPYIGVAVQNNYYDNVVVFSDGSTKALTIDPGTGFVYGAEVGYRFRPPWSARISLATSEPGASDIENLTVRPDIDFRTTQLDLGLLYDLTTFSVNGKTAPLAVGGGLTVTFHSLNRFTFDGKPIKPSPTSLGVHGVAAFDYPVAPRISVRGQGKLAITPLAFGEVEDALARAEGGGVTAQLKSHTSVYLVLLGGATIRF